MADAILDPFHRELAKELEMEVTAKMFKLAMGDAFPTGGEVRTVGERYAYIVGEISSLRAVMEICKQIETKQNTIQPRTAGVTIKNHSGPDGF